MRAKPTICVMLDVDGVLVNGRPSDGLHWSHGIEADLGVSPKALREMFFRVCWEDIVTGQRSLRPALADCLAQLSTRVSAEDVISYWFAHDSRIDETVLHDCDDARVRGFKVFLATNQEHLRAAYLMTTLGLKDHFDGMVYSAQVGQRKPHRAFFMSAANLIGYEPNDLLLIDDTFANVVAAQDCGWLAEQWVKDKSVTGILASL